jgi:uncharacterized protein YcnI
MNTKIKLTLAALAALMLVIPAAASAHVTLQPKFAPEGGFTRLDVRVPNEEDDAATNKVEVQFPAGFAFVSYEPVPGWTINIAKEKLPEPIEGGHGPITEQVKTVTFTADDPAAAIQPGQFEDFGLSVGVPDTAKEGDVLTFPAIQTYDNGTVVRWIEEGEDAEKPAPTVEVSEPAEDHGAEADDEAEADDKDDDSASVGLGIAALALGAVGTALGASAFIRSRKS